MSDAPQRVSTEARASDASKAEQADGSRAERASGGNDPNGMRVFFLVWLGQVISLLGSSLTSFALGVWLYQRSGAVTDLAVVNCVAVLPSLLIAPLAGVLVDRWDRRHAMLLSDIGAALGSVTVLLLLLMSRLALWNIILTVAVSSMMGALRFPAYSASVTVLVPAKHLGRAAGMVQFGWALSQLIAPVVAGLLLPIIGLKGILMIDLSSFAFALLTLIVVRFPRPKPSATPNADNRSLLAQARESLGHIKARPGLRSLLVFCTMCTFCLGMAQVLSTPLILGFTNTANLGFMLSLGGVGMLLGSAAMIALGGPRRRVHGVLSFGILQGMMVLLAGLRPSVPLVTVAAFGFLFAAPVIASCNEIIWQRMVAPEVQGRVFATRNMVIGASLPLASLIAGPLADKVFEPLLAAGGALTSSLGGYLGVGPGRGIGLIYALLGTLTVLVSLLGYFHAPLRKLEDDLAEAELKAAKA